VNRNGVGGPGVGGALMWMGRVNAEVELEHGQRRMWHFGLTNFGNESTLQAFLFHMRRLLPQIEISCICTGPTATANAYKIKALPISRTMVSGWMPQGRAWRMLRSLLVGGPCEVYRWFEGMRTLKAKDVLVIPGTGLISDAYGLTGWGPYNLFKWSVIAKLRGCKLLFVSVGAGPLYGRLGRFYAKTALALADCRTYRDVSSLEYLKSIGFRKPEDRVCPDLAFSLPQSPLTHNSAGNETGSIKRRVAGVGVMLYAGKYSVENPDDKTFRNYFEQLVILVEWLLARDYNVRLLIGDLCDRPVVQEFSCALKERFADYDESRILHDDVVTVDQLLSQIAETEFVVATRFHNVLLALANEKPVVAISFHHKVASLMDAMGLSEYCLDINGLEGEELVAKALQAERNADVLTHRIRERTQSCRAALEEQYRRIVSELS
jgi:polysaccharide pyruvyl transferase WcaK-like protein